MQRKIVFLILSAFCLGFPGFAESIKPSSTTQRPFLKFADDDVTVRSATVSYLEDLDLLVFEQSVAGQFGHTRPAPRGQLQGAPVLGYVFPTTLAPENVGFGRAVESGAEEIVALAVTLHPDFDDTPLWDENGDRDFDNDGAAYHSHWVVLGKDHRVPGGLAVVAADPANGDILPPTNPGMPMFMDSPGFSVVFDKETLRVLVPRSRVGGRTDFGFDAVVAFMQVDTGGELPMLGVYEIYSVLSGDLSLPFRVKSQPRP